MKAAGGGTHLFWHVSVLDARVEQLEVAGEEVPLGKVMRTEQSQRAGKS